MTAAGARPGLKKRDAAYRLYLRVAGGSRNLKKVRAFAIAAAPNLWLLWPAE